MTGLELSLLITPTAGLLIAGFLVWFTGRPRKSSKAHHPAE